MHSQFPGARQSIPLIEAESGRLLQQHVLAGIDRGDRDFDVDLGRNADSYRLDGWIVDEGAKIGVTTLDLEGVADLVEAGLIGIGDRDHLGAVEPGKGREVTLLGNPAAADNPHPQRPAGAHGVKSRTLLAAMLALRGAIRCPERPHLCSERGPPLRWRRSRHASVGFYSVADSDYFLGATALLNSLRLIGHREPFYLLDGGLAGHQREQLASECTLVPIPAGLAPKMAKWLAPLAHPARTMVLLDADVVVVRIRTAG